jgi:hypothetical protein
MSGLGIIEQQPVEVCEMCGAVDECRPYGPNGENICFTCATTKCDIEQVEKRMAQHIFGDK